MGYRKLDEKDIAYLKKVTEDGRVLTGSDISQDYSHDELGGVERAPEALVRVLSTGEVSDIMAYASREGIPVVTRGSGTGLVGAAVAIHGGIMLETTQMNHILELDRRNLTVTVEPGVLLMELAQYVEENGLFYPPDPGEKSATIGGNISTNAGGMRAVKYGVTRDYVRALTVVLPTGEVVEFGGKTVKNSSGYSLLNLMIGSEGTLGVITRAVLKLVPLPGKTVSLLVPFADMEQAIEMVPVIVEAQIQATAIEFMERETILFAEEYLGKRFPDTRNDAYILLTFDGRNAEQVRAEYQEVADLCLEHGALDVFIVDTQERKQSVWNARGAFLEAIKASTTQMDECDVVVPRDRVADFIKYTHEVAGILNLRIPSFGHAGDGNLHVYLCRDDLAEDEWKEKLSLGFEMMYARAREYGGAVSGEHGIGYAKKEYLKEQLGDTQIGLMRRIKKAFDPNLILNTDKVV